MRISGVTIPDNKQLAYSLPLIFGIGPTRARDSEGGRYPHA